jgi:hypothetical protein
LAAWVLLAAAFGCGVFDQYVPAAVVLVAAVASAVVAFRPAGAAPRR